MSDEFPYDVFFSHSAKDKAVVRPLAERLRADGVKHSDFGFRHSDFGFTALPDGACVRLGLGAVESGTFRFRDPLNKERRFLPLRLNDTPIKGFLAQFLYVELNPTRPIFAPSKQRSMP